VRFDLFLRFSGTRYTILRVELGVDESVNATGIATWNRERIVDAIVRIVLIVGTVLPAAYVTSIGLSDLSNRLARLDVGLDGRLRIDFQRSWKLSPRF